MQTDVRLGLSITCSVGVASDSTLASAVGNSEGEQMHQCWECQILNMVGMMKLLGQNMLQQMAASYMPEFAS
jgi:hypothetical protein